MLQVLSKLTSSSRGRHLSVKLAERESVSPPRRASSRRVSSASAARISPGADNNDDDDDYSVDDTRMQPEYAPPVDTAPTYAAPTYEQQQPAFAAAPAFSTEAEYAAQPAFAAQPAYFAQPAYAAEPSYTEPVAAYAEPAYQQPVYQQLAYDDAAAYGGAIDAGGGQLQAADAGGGGGAPAGLADEAMLARAAKAGEEGWKTLKLLLNKVYTFAVEMDTAEAKLSTKCAPRRCRSGRVNDIVNCHESIPYDR